MKVLVIQVPYDSGQRDVRMGSGPEHLIRHGLIENLQTAGHDVRFETVESNAEFRAEVQTQFQLYRLLSDRIAEARQHGDFPLILSGNCGATLGATAVANGKSLGLIWFDAHGDFNTPEITTSGFLDGMGLAIATGLCWKSLALTIPRFSPVDCTRILHVGGRDFDPAERALFDEVGALVVEAAAIPEEEIRGTLEPALAKLRTRIEVAHLHIDLDVLNPNEAPANHYAVEGRRLSVEQLLDAIRLIKENVQIISATLAGYDPRYDPHAKTVAVSFRLINEILVQ